MEEEYKMSTAHLRLPTREQLGKSDTVELRLPIREQLDENASNVAPSAYIIPIAAENLPEFVSEEHGIWYSGFGVPAEHIHDSGTSTGGSVAA